MSNPTTTEEKDDNCNMNVDLVEKAERNDNEQGVTTAVQTSDEGQLSQQQSQRQQQQQQAIIDFVEKYALTDNDNDVMRERMISLIQKKVNKGTSLPVLKVFLRDHALDNQQPSDKELDDFARAILNDYEQNDSTIRPVYVDYKITDTELSHDYDLVSFVKHVETLATEYWNNDSNSKETPPYVAPYFCLIQSSGMGKTKLLYEYRKNYSHKNFFESKLLLVSKVQTDPMNEKVYDAKYEALLSKDAKTKSSNLEVNRKTEAQLIFHRLDTLVNYGLKWDKKKKSRFRVLLFDEAHLLLKEEFGMKAFQLCCICVWLRKMQQHKYVAVFTGTSCGLTNFDMEMDRKLIPYQSSRGMGDSWVTISKGSTVFPPFVMLTTIGCQIQLKQATTGPHSTEYDDAIIHGRPLFSLMNDHGHLEAQLPNILHRMLLLRGGENEGVNWENNLNAWFSILATRVQMGITTIAVASDLVAKGYANLTHVSPGFAQFTYLPDPVCARLAMGMMSNGWKLGDIKGKSPSEWVGHLGQIYSSGLCQPEKGDFGEVLAALYFLLCGDILRHRCDDDLKTFSVDLDLCFALLMNGGNTDVTKTPDLKRSRMDKEKKQSSVTLSCIQFCHNYLRSYETNWSTLGDQQFLRQLYASGTGFFTFAGCPTIDAVFALCIRKGTSEKYIPCLLSIKSHNYFSHDMAQELCVHMKVQAENSELQALCIVVVFGASIQSKNDESTFKKNDESVFNNDTYTLLANGKTVAVVLRIPVDDVFGISGMYQQLSSNTDLVHVYGSHSFIRAHTGKSKSVALDPKFALLNYRMIMIWCRLSNMSKHWPPNIGTTTAIPKKPLHTLLHTSASFNQALLLVSKVQTDPMNEKVYDAKYEALLSKDAKTKSSNLEVNRKTEAQLIFHRLDTLVNYGLKWDKKKKSRFRVLLFDEAHLLLKEEFGMKAFQLCCICVWLRKMQQHKYVAVFTGTSCGLTNFDMEMDRKLIPYQSSRGMGDSWVTISKGSTVFPPFVMLTTIGCQIQLKQATTGPHSTEYDDAIIHGRPLFSLMNNHGHLEAQLPNILRRMLLLRGGENEGVNWENNLNAWFNPVCARLAMGMMSNGWKLGDIKGKSPSEWVGHLGQIYSSGLSLPDKGDFGEVLAALYFLLCGDILRHGFGGDLKTFSVDLDLCFALLSNGGNTGAVVAAAAQTPDLKRPKMDKEGKQSSKTLITLSCIQFCRNYLRSYETNWSSLGDQQFLRQLYTSGTGFFTFVGCSTVDAVFPLCIRKGTSEKYIPCLVSIKSHIHCSHEMAQELCHEMKVQAENSELQALCIVVVFGASIQSKNDESTFKKNDESVFNNDTYTLLANGKTVAVVLRIPVDDVFGISGMYQQLSSNTDLVHVYGSHSFIRAHTGKSKSVALDPKFALRASSSGSTQTPAESLLDTLSEQLKQSPPSQ
ncbi:type III restriction enzyme [Nitzschia inconspicua]|uniref:Type III restriction enzyme n=1 Tax=Nitzschia inconspicua TaxID=303405 RepID=A0A9K3PX40_9STRA|nr:type III restriction enzyme [Nitzschia inconspicua]KAG7362591.1 type III restriction enzyme [Nitzschia inconspicua]